MAKVTNDSLAARLDGFKELVIEWNKSTDAHLSEIKEQTTKTNGRVTAHELALAGKTDVVEFNKLLKMINRMVGGLILLNIIGVPLLIWLLNTLDK